MKDRVFKKGFYVHYLTFDDGYGEEVEGYLGPFETSDKAYSEMSKIEDEKWISGQSVYYCTYVMEVKEDETCSNEKR